MASGTHSSSAWSRLRDHLHTTQLLGGIHSTLYFDQNTAMPAAAGMAVFWSKYRVLWMPPSSWVVCR